MKKSKSMRLAKIVFYASVVAFAVGLIIGEYGANLQSEVEAMAVEDRVLLEKRNLEKKIKNELKEKLKRGVLDDLASCETGGLKDPDGAIILDTNNEMSIGRYMFQRETIRYYYKKFYKKEISRAEAVKIAVDREKATELAEKILFDDREGWKNWYNCAKKLNLKTRIKDINNL